MGEHTNLSLRSFVCGTELELDNSLANCFNEFSLLLLFALFILMLGLCFVSLNRTFHVAFLSNTHLIAGQKFLISSAKQYS